MPTERLSMRDVREILRQKWQLGRSHRQVAGSVGASAGAVGETMRRAKAAGVTSWAEIEGLSPSALEARLYPPTATAAAKPTPDCAWIHRERRRVGVTLQLLHLEYAEQQPDVTQAPSVTAPGIILRAQTTTTLTRSWTRVVVRVTMRRPWNSVIWLARGTAVVVTPRLSSSSRWSRRFVAAPGSTSRGGRRRSSCIMGSAPSA